MALVYLVRNKITDKVYIGQTFQELNQRWIRHKAAATQGRSSYFPTAIRKYGPESFDIKPLVIVGTKEDADFYEKKLISIFRSNEKQFGYNVTAGGDVQPMDNPESREKVSTRLKGRIVSDKTKALQSKSKKEWLSGHPERHNFWGRHHSEETKELLSRLNTGRKVGPFSEAHKEKISKSNLGKKMSSEARLNMSLGKRGKPWSEARRAFGAAIPKGTPWSQNRRNAQELTNAA